MALLSALHALAQAVKNADEIICELAPKDDRCGRGSIGIKPRPIALDIPFELNSSRLQESATAQLDQLAVALTSSSLSESDIQIVGHTDSSGSAEYNRTLSARRAESVREYLVQKHGLSPVRLAAAGRGEDEPLRDRSPEAPENRRVEIRLLSRD
jgi:OOP family OmpA-OmpF porin